MRWVHAAQSKPIHGGVSAAASPPEARRVLRPALRQPRQPSGQINHRAFTIVELCLVIGILLVLIAIAMPAIGKSLASARAANLARAGAQCAVAIASYQRDWKGVYPIGRSGDTVDAKARSWYEPVMAGNYIELGETPANSDDIREPFTQTVLSFNMLSRPETFTPSVYAVGNELPIGAVLDHEVRFPSGKGMLVRHQTGRIEDGTARFWCCPRGVSASAPVTFADGHVTSLTWTDFVLETPFEPATGLGAPVLSTWGGVRVREYFK